MMTLATLTALLLGGCGDKDGGDDTGPHDGGTADGGTTDGGTADGGTTDGGTPDGGTTDGGTTDGGTTDGGTTDCGVDIVSITPVDAETEVDPGVVVTAVLSAEDPTATLSLSDAKGAAVPGLMQVHGAGLTFTPDAELAEGSAYTTHLAWCDGSASTSFLTRTWPDPLGWDPTGSTWAIDVETVDWREPKGVADLVLAGSTPDLLIHVTGYGPGLDMRWAWSDHDVTAQDTCIATVDPPTMEMASLPDFTAGPEDGILLAVGQPALVKDMVITGLFEGEGEPLRALRIEGEADMRDWSAVLADLVGVSDPDEVCAIMVSFGVLCAPCAGDGESYCVRIEGASTSATPVSIPVVERTESVIAHDPECGG